MQRQFFLQILVKGGQGGNLDPPFGQQKPHDNGGFLLASELFGHPPAAKGGRQRHGRFIPPTDGRGQAKIVNGRERVFQRSFSSSPPFRTVWQSGVNSPPLPAP